MKQYKNIVLVAIGIVFLITSCQNNSENNDDATETPQAFQDENIIKEVSSYSKRGYINVVDKLYNELLEKDAELKEIEKQITQLNKDNYEGNIGTNKFISDNSQYYNELEPYVNDTILNMKSYVNKITDSTLREEIIVLINKSEENYKLKITKLEELQEKLEDKVIEMNDYKTALKIALTLQSIEKYQDNYKQDTVELNKLIKRFDELILRIKNK